MIGNYPTKLECKECFVSQLYSIWHISTERKENKIGYVHKPICIVLQEPYERDKKVFHFKKKITIWAMLSLISIPIPILKPIEKMKNEKNRPDRFIKTVKKSKIKNCVDVRE